MQIVITAEQLAHILSGFLSALSVILSPVLTVIGFAGFEIYENLQYLKSEDWAVSETLEFMEGFFAAVVLMLFLRVAGAV